VLTSAAVKPEAVKYAATVREGEDAATTEGERKTFSALFADIKGSMELMEEIDPEDARAIVDPALKILGKRPVTDLPLDPNIVDKLILEGHDLMQMRLRVLDQVRDWRDFLELLEKLENPPRRPWNWRMTSRFYRSAI